MKALNPFHILHGGALVLFTIFAIFPIVWTISVAFSADSSTMWLFPRAFWPNQLSLDWFGRVWQEIPIARYFINSLGISISTTIIVILLAIPCGYAFAMHDFRGKNALLALLVITLMVPSEVAFIPNFLTINRLGLLDSYTSAILPNIASAFGVLMMKQAFQDLPRETLDAARVDGASEMQLLWRIALPQTMPMVATLTVFSFVLAWNDYFWPSVVLKSREKMPLAVGMFNDLTGPFATSTSMVLAAVTIALVPILILFVATQRHFLSDGMQDSTT
ncbi:carbohydrate ABC transporter permease [Chitinibacter bivalviorum]|uniref:sn-glycerol-3-phosphate transport system permease protein UgpE n=2 Tax=Chitinibacter bivalviorum TaxID=2739434 RepID=A0A7H9BNJ2_9NEIS|nr:carbohydrate ABC transporter permease [Chitinibacter bivalviorum]